MNSFWYQRVVEWNNLFDWACENAGEMDAVRVNAIIWTLDKHYQDALRLARQMEVL